MQINPYNNNMVTLDISIRLFRNGNLRTLVVTGASVGSVRAITLSDIDRPSSDTNNIFNAAGRIGNAKINADGSIVMKYYPSYSNTNNIDIPNDWTLNFEVTWAV